MKPLNCVPKLNLSISQEVGHVGEKGWLAQIYPWPYQTCGETASVWCPSPEAVSLHAFVLHALSMSSSSIKSKIYSTDSIPITICITNPNQHLLSFPAHTKKILKESSCVEVQQKKSINLSQSALDLSCFLKSSHPPSPQISQNRFFENF